MRTHRIAVAVGTLIILAGCGEDPPKPANPEQTGAASTAAVPPDNSGRHARDDGSTVTPLDQGRSAGDLAITRAVRQGMVDTKGIAISGQNSTIITRDGIVTLRGPIASAGERDTIFALAERVPEVKSVKNQLEIAP